MMQMTVEDGFNDNIIEMVELSDHTDLHIIVNPYPKPVNSTVFRSKDLRTPRNLGDASFSHVMCT